MTFEELKPKINDILTNVSTLREEKLQKICFLLNENIDYYDWVGFYFRNGEKEELILGPYVGEKTDHTVIPFGKGICGQVALSNEPFIVHDVSAEDNYIACSASVKSEIVVPIFVNGENIGQIDIDSEVRDAFTEDDQAFLEYINYEIGKLFVES
ncbi:MAG TPA: GAF domain-containing protein [Flavobacterium sp.]|jgi:GAF domain-containing protein